MNDDDTTAVDGAVRLAGEALMVAQHAVYWKLYRAALDRKDNAAMRHAQGLLDMIGWPNGKRPPAVEVPPADIDAIRRAVVRDMQEDASNIFNALGRVLTHPETPLDGYFWGALKDFDRCRNLLRRVGWEMA